MQRLLSISVLAVSVLVLMGGFSAAAMATNATRHGTTNVFNITVNCLNGTQAKKTASSAASTTSVNLSINCASSGGTPGQKGDKGDKGDTGAPGKNGVNATVTFLTASNQTANSTKLK